MTDLKISKENLGGHSICLCKEGNIITDDGRGISPMMRFIAEGRDLSGCSAADVIVGKASAMLFVKAGINEVYGKVMSPSKRRSGEGKSYEHTPQFVFKVEWKINPREILCNRC